MFSVNISSPAGPDGLFRRQRILEAEAAGGGKEDKNRNSRVYVQRLQETGTERGPARRGRPPMDRAACRRAPFAALENTAYWGNGRRFPRLIEYLGGIIAGANGACTREVEEAFPDAEAPPLASLLSRCRQGGRGGLSRGLHVRAEATPGGLICRIPCTSARRHFRV